MNFQSESSSSRNRNHLSVTNKYLKKQSVSMLADWLGSYMGRYFKHTAGTSATTLHTPGMELAKPIYLNQEKHVAGPSFARFCKDFRHNTPNEFDINTNGSGIYLWAPGRHMVMRYKPNSLVLLELRRTVHEPTYWVCPKGGRSRIVQYLGDHEPAPRKTVLETSLPAISEVLKGMRVHSNNVIENAVLELSEADRFAGLPDDMPFFFPGRIPISTSEYGAVLFMEEENFLHADCYNGTRRTRYVPGQADK